jgi:hypothetical protein
MNFIFDALFLFVLPAISVLVEVLPRAAFLGARGF